MRLDFAQPALRRLLLALVALTLGWATYADQGSTGSVAPPVPVDAQAAAERLAAAVRIPTIAYDEQAASAESLSALHAHLQRSFPLVHRTLRRERINEFSLLYTWVGKDPSRPPILLMAHQDVVPVAPGSEAAWTHPPFSGAIADGHIWGRGAWDDKSNLLAMLEAAEQLIAQGFQPEQTIYFAFGHDEETGPQAGQQGAHAIAATLKARGVHLASVLDEGLLITHGMMNGLAAPVALIGVAEKGYLTLELSAKGVPGHSSMPPKETAIGKLSAALTRLEAAQAPPHISPVVREMLETVAPEMGGLQGFALRNLCLLEALVRQQMAKTPAGAAMLGTTTALTVLRAGNKENVLPENAEATVNFRILPGDNVAEVIARTRLAINDGDIRITPLGVTWEPSPVSHTDSATYRAIKASVQAVFPGTLVAPGLMIAATDSRHYQGIADNIYRFSPIHATPDDLARFHGTDERLAVSNYADMIRFYINFLQESGAGP